MSSSEISEILDGRVWQGSAPIGPVRQDIVVLCAEEYQPPAILLAKPESDVVRAPMDDATMDDRTLRESLAAADRVAAEVKRGRTVLVTCMQGRNRSGLVSALSLYLLTGTPGDRIVRYIRSRRKDALTNEAFASFLRGLPARPKRVAGDARTAPLSP